MKTKTKLQNNKYYEIYKFFALMDELFINDKPKTKKKIHVYINSDTYEILNNLVKENNSRFPIIVRAILNDYAQFYLFNKKIKPQNND